MKVIVFDLDDTLYKEIDFLKSAYRVIASSTGHPEAYDYMLASYHRGENAFEQLIKKYHLTCSVETLLDIYRSHKPDICLSQDVIAALDQLKSKGVIIGMITDGRSVTQRNKIEALGLGQWIDNEDILISEEFGCGKPDKRCYRYFIDKRPDAQHYYVGDNLGKDFVTANKVGWSTMCLLDDGRNIFKQDFTIETQYLPKYKIKTIEEILNII